MKLSSQKQLLFLIFLYATPFTYAEMIGIFAENGGHSGVTQSLLVGLHQLGISYIYNDFSKPFDVAIVLAGIGYLQKAIQLKRMGKIKKLLVGPNVVTRADEYGSICAAPEVDICLVPSEWVRVAYEEEVSNLKNRIKIWWAGVDEAFLVLSQKKKGKVLVYWKTEPESFIQSIESKLKSYSYDVIRVRYGHYTKKQFYSYLSEAFLAIFVSVSESQGLALAEAWAMDVPTFVWNPRKLTAHGRVYSQVSSAPYLTRYTGFDWQMVDDLDFLLQKFKGGDLDLTPRDWALNNLTHAHSTRCLLSIIAEII